MDENEWTYDGTLTPNRRLERFGDVGHEFSKGVRREWILGEGKVLEGGFARDELIITDIHCHVFDPFEI